MARALLAPLALPALPALLALPEPLVLLALPELPVLLGPPEPRATLATLAALPARRVRMAKTALFLGLLVLRATRVILVQRVTLVLPAQWGRLVRRDRLARRDRREFLVPA